MNRDELIEAMALGAFNRMRERAMMRPVNSIGANNTPEANAFRSEAAANLVVIEAVACVVPKEPDHRMVDAVYDAIARSQSVNVYGLQPSERRRVMPRMVVEAMTEASPFRGKP